MPSNTLLYRLLKASPHLDPSLMTDTSYRFGIEEEFFLADAGTRGTPGRRTSTFHAAAAKHLRRVEPELLQSQIETSSPPCTSFAEARATLAGLRKGLAEIGRRHGILIFAAGTHPLARWSRQKATQAGRYEKIMREVGMLGSRNVVCGMHVHVEVPRPERRIDLMNRLLPFLPALFALSTSSPFWQGRATGLSGYRLSAFGELPRTGLPELFADAADYDRYVRIMMKAGAVKDASFLWWAIRPSLKYPTLELRVADSCTSLDDAIAIAALYRCLVRRIDRDPNINSGLTGASRAIAAENLWRAQADGVRAELIDEKQERSVPFADYLASILQLVEQDADILGCAAEVQATVTLADQGTSSDRQIAVYNHACSGAATGGSDREALRAVADWLASATANC